MVKIRIETIDDIGEDEVIIRCGRVDDTVQKIHRFILELSSSDAKITYFKKNQEYYFPVDDVLFFETDAEHIYAHTVNDSYRIKYRLYELEDILPRYFVRSAKSTIINIKKVYSIERNITASSLVSFINSHKQVYVSRYYYKQLRQLLKDRGKFEK